MKLLMHIILNDHFFGESKDTGAHSIYNYIKNDRLGVRTYPNFKSTPKYKIEEMNVKIRNEFGSQLFHYLKDINELNDASGTYTIKLDSYTIRVRDFDIEKKIFELVMTVISKDLELIHMNERYVTVKEKEVYGDDSIVISMGNGIHIHTI